MAGLGQKPQWQRAASKQANPGKRKDWEVVDHLECKAETSVDRQNCRRNPQLGAAWHSVAERTHLAGELGEQNVHMAQREGTAHQPAVAAQLAELLAVQCRRRSGGACADGQSQWNQSSMELG